MKSTTSIALILISIGLFYTFTSPQYKELKALLVEKSEYKAVLKDISAIEQMRDGLQESYRNLPQEEMTRLARALPDDVDAVRLAYDLDAMAAKYGISIKELSVKRVEESDTIVIEDPSRPYERATVSFGFVASYVNFKKFLSDMEKSLRIIDIKELAFEVGEKDALYEYQLAIDTYWLK